MSSTFSLRLQRCHPHFHSIIFETLSCLRRWVQLTFLCVFQYQNSSDVDFDIFKNSMRYFLQLLLFSDTQILPSRIDFCTVYFSVNNCNRSFTQQSLVKSCTQNSERFEIDIAGAQGIFFPDFQCSTLSTVVEFLQVQTCLKVQTGLNMQKEISRKREIFT